MASTFVSYLNITGDSVVPGPVPVGPFDPGSGNVFPKMIDRINETAWELWYFDGGTEDGKTAVSVSFFRDARGLRDGGFRTQIFAMWPDGSMWSDELYFVESIVTAEGNSPAHARVHGVWKTYDDGASVSFTIAADLSTASLTFSVPNRVSGTMELRALSGSEAGLPSTEAEALLSPSHDMYYIRPISLARVSVDLTFDVEDPARDNGKQRTLGFHSGRGGMDRCWTPLSWPQLMTESYFLRATVGPYTMQVMRIVSDAASGKNPHATARLWRDEELICVAQQVVDLHAAAQGVLAQDAVVVEKVYGADAGGNPVTGAFRDKNTGYHIEFVQGIGPKEKKRNKRWRFEVRHNQPWWNMPTSAPGPQATGNSGFLETVFGGADDETWPEGVGGAGQVELQ